MIRRKILLFLRDHVAKINTGELLPRDHWLNLVSAVLYPIKTYLAMQSLVRINFYDLTMTIRGKRYTMDWLDSDNGIGVPEK